MTGGNTKQVRRQILELLYERYLQDPMHSLMPQELYVETGLSPEEVTPAAFYLHERELVDLMVGFNPPNFDAVRISAAGIDLVENRADFDRQFPAGAKDDETPSFMGGLLQLIEEIEASSLGGARRDWLIEDVKVLRDLLRVPSVSWDGDGIQVQLARIEEYFGADDRKKVPALEELVAGIESELFGE